MILTDTGPIVALLNADDQFHEQCAKLLARLPPVPLLTTQICFTEGGYVNMCVNEIRRRPSPVPIL